MNKNSTLFLALALSTATGCFFPRGYSPNGSPGPGGNANAAVSASATVDTSVDGTLPGIAETGATDTEPTDPEPTDGTTEGGEAGAVEAGATPPTTPPAPNTGGLGDGLDAAGMCTKASTCTTRVSMEVCGLFNLKCLDAYHKQGDGATYEKCKAKLDRLPGIVEKTAPAGYTLPAECR